MKINQYDHIFVVNGVPISDVRSAEGEGALYEQADNFLAEHGDEGDVYIIGSDGVWWKRVNNFGITNNTWEPVEPPPIVVMYRLINC